MSINSATWKYGEHYYFCSVCGAEAKKKYYFCPHCGRYMSNNAEE